MFSSGSPLPIKEGSTSTWIWAHDGTTSDGVLELLADGRVKWYYGDRQGSWELRDGGKILDITFNSVFHELKYKDGKANLIVPSRTPPSSMTIIMSGNDQFIIFFVTQFRVGAILPP